MAARSGRMPGRMAARSSRSSFCRHQPPRPREIARSAPLDLLEQALEFGFGLAGKCRGIDLVDIHRVADDDDSHHAQRRVWLADDHVDAGFGEGDGGVLVHLGIERRCTRGDHAGDRVDFVPFVGRDESYRIAGSDAHELRVEYEETARSTVELLHLDLFAHRWEPYEAAESEGHNPHSS